MMGQCFCNSIALHGFSPANDMGKDAIDGFGE